jgi:nucleotide-binding universal stress UspA family protein
MSTQTRLSAPAPIVVGVDGSASALAAARWAADEADHRQAPLRLVHAVAQPALAHGGGLGLPEEFSAALESDGRGWPAEARAAVLDRRPGLVVELDLAAAPVASLVAVSRAAQLLVMRAVGLGGFPSLLTDSTAVALLTQARCPVAVIRGRTDAGGPPSSGPVVVGVWTRPSPKPTPSTATSAKSWT